MHEFEALILSDPMKIGTLIDGRKWEIQQLVEECQPFPNPELINKGQHGHPKARIKKYLPEYDENVHGPLLAEAIGLQNFAQNVRISGSGLAVWKTWTEKGIGS